MRVRDTLLSNLDDEEKEKMTKGFEAFFQNHTHENNNSPLWNCEDPNPFISMFMKPPSECTMFIEGEEVTPVEKCVDFDDLSYDVKAQNWRKKHICQWSELDVMKWIMDTFTSKGLKYDEIDISKFKMKGDSLYCMDLPDFELLDKKYGSMLFSCLSELRRDTESSSSKLITLTTISADQFKPLLCKEELAYPELIDFESKNEKKKLSQIDMGASERRPVGRPKGQNRRRSAKKFGRLWEFIRDMLHDPNYCPSLIRWVDHDKGLFKFERSDAVARVWGNIKKNPRMNYEKLSRAMRYYYKSKVFMAVEHQRLVYRFGPNAKGWQTNNPNFEKPVSKL